MKTLFHKDLRVGRFVVTALCNLVLRLLMDASLRTMLLVPEAWDAVALIKTVAALLVETLFILLTVSLLSRRFFDETAAGNQGIANLRTAEVYLLSFCVSLIFGYIYIAFMKLPIQGVIYGVVSDLLVSVWLIEVMRARLMYEARHRLVEMRHNSEVKSLKEDRLKLQLQLERSAFNINNHFIFNTFSILDGLIEESPESASNFLGHLSNLFRKIVSIGSAPSIDLQDEVDIVNDWWKMMKYRFPEGISLRIDESLADCQGDVIPMTLQSLAENAIVHNAHGARALLMIEIYCEDEYVVVKNNINPLVSEFVSTGRGLANIRQKYSLLTDAEILISSTEQAFCVKVPILKKR